MPSSANINAIQILLDGIAGGDPTMKLELAELAGERFRKIARNMLNVSYPQMNQDGVESVQIASAATEHMRKFMEMEPGKCASAKEFLFQASDAIRETLIDLAKQLCEWGDQSPNQTPQGIRLPDQPDPAKWRRAIGFLEAIGRMPSEQQQIVDLLFFQGFTPIEAAGILGLDESVVKRRWSESRIHLAGTA